MLVSSLNPQGEGGGQLGKAGGEKGGTSKGEIDDRGMHRRRPGG